MKHDNAHTSHLSRQPRHDPRRSALVEAMRPYFTEIYGNAGSTTHAFGAAAKDAVEDARGKIAAAIGAKAKEIVCTSGATESNNLAIRGVAQRHAGHPLAGRGRHIIAPRPNIRPCSTRWPDSRSTDSKSRSCR